MEKQFKHIMIDLETLGLEPGSIIRSCAAVEFDPETGETGERKEWKLNLSEAQNEGFKIDTSTIKWWLTRSEAARKDFVEGEETSLVEFLLQLKAFILLHGDDVTLWCLQLDFDLPMLRCYYKWMNKTVISEEEFQVPWNRRKIRDVRPYMDALETAGLLPPKVADRHTPMADCLAQINYVHLAIKNNLTIR